MWNTGPVEKYLQSYQIRDVVLDGGRVPLDREALELPGAHLLVREEPAVVVAVGAGLVCGAVDAVPGRREGHQCHVPSLRGT